MFVVLIAAVVVLAINIRQNARKDARTARARKKAEFTQEQLYSGIVKHIESGKYLQACQMWEAHKPSGRYTLEYNDLSAQYHYAKALGGYVGAKEVCLADVCTALERVPEHFRNVEKYRKEIAALCNSVRGVYTKEDAAASEYRLDIDSRGFLSVQYNQPSNYITVNYIKKGKASWTVQNGEITAGRVASGHYFLAMEPLVGGMEVNDARRFGNDLKLCGTYVRRNDLKPADQSEEP